MASTDATAIPVKNQAYRVTFPIWDADGDLVTGATGLDSEVSKDGGTFADCTNEATEIATSSGMYYLDLTSTEMNADTVAIIVKTSSSGAKTTPIVLYPQEAADIKVSVTHWNGTAVATPATAGIPDVNVKNMNNVAATSVTTINANQGTTQPVNYTGTGASALVKSDMVDVAGAAVSTSTAQIGVNAVNIGGTAQTGRDIGASVLLSSGTGTGQLDFTSGVVKANLAQILGTALTETSGQIAAAFKKFFDKASPTGTINSIPDAVAGASGGLFIAGSNAATTANITGNITGNVSGSVGSVTGNVGGNVTGSVGSIATGGIAAASFAAGAIDATAIATDAIGANEVSAAAVTKIQAGLSTYAGGAVASVTGNVGGNVVGSVGSVTGAVTVGTNNDKTGYGLSAAAVQAIWDALTSALTTANSIGKLLVDNINATISSRSTVTTAQVNAEVVDALAIDTYAEPGSVPAATATLAAKIGWLFTLARNKRTTTSAVDTVRNDADSGTIATSAISDDGTTFTRGEYT